MNSNQDPYEYPTISEVIKELQRIQKLVGDVTVWVNDTYLGIQPAWPRIDREQGETPIVAF